MAASSGTAIHNSVEDLCNLDISDRDAEEVGWLDSTAREVLERNWREERQEFLDTPRHPSWKNELFSKALDGLTSALGLLLEKATLPKQDLPGVSIRSWRQVQSIVIATEATLESDCGRLMGRLDLLILDPEKKEEEGWIVADLKTGRPPGSELDEKVRRQLLFYRDIMRQGNPEKKSIVAEGWYSSNETIYVADGTPILEEAIEAWGSMAITKTPFQATPSESSCSFCDWKAWCPDWWVSRDRGLLGVGRTFRDEVTKLVRLDRESGAALFERATPLDDEGALGGSEYRFGAILKGRALEKIKQLEQDELDGYLFLGSARADGKIVHMGDWSEILPWKPLLESTSN